MVMSPARSSSSWRAMFLARQMTGLPVRAPHALARFCAPWEIALGIKIRASNLSLNVALDFGTTTVQGMLR